jgi:hypothetical protein
MSAELVELFDRSLLMAGAGRFHGQPNAKQCQNQERHSQTDFQPRSTANERESTH